MNSNAIDGGFRGFVFLMAFAGTAVTIFWMVVAWRAMRAHERLASAAEALSRNRRSRRATKRTEAEDLAEEDEELADSVQCLSCGKSIPGGALSCPSCGWSWRSFTSGPT